MLDAPGLLSGSVSTAGSVAAAVAECLHLDGRFEAAANAWQALAVSNGRDGKAALKAAISLIMCGRRADAEPWLRRAAGGGCTGEVAYVRGQLAGDAAEARRNLLEAVQCAPRSGKALNLLGVLSWRLGDAGAALARFRQAWRIDPNDGEARLNEACCHFANNQEVPQDLLAEAARLIPHRPEPHVLWSRALRRAGRSVEADRSLERARIRRLPRSMPPEDADCRPVIEVDAAVTMRDDGVRMECRLTAAEIPRPARFRLNRGCTVVSNGTVECGEAVYLVGPECWAKGAEGWTLQLRIIGMPVAPMVAFRSTEIELGGGSAWFPLFENARLIPRLSWDIPFGAEVWWNANPRGGIDALLLMKPEVLESSSAQIGRVVRSEAAVSDDVARHAATRFAASIAAWNDLLGDSVKPPPLLVLPRPASSFCYARADYIRVASGAIARGTDLLMHEAGHLWWGIGTCAAPEDEWLTEGLAESIFHDGDRRRRAVYRAAVIDRLNKQEPGTSTGLAELARRGDLATAALLREKGGYFFAMLHRLLGDDEYRQFLRELYVSCRGRRITPWIVRALASAHRHQCLHWFFAQWADAAGGLAFRAAILEAGESALRVRVENRGIFSIGAPVVVELETEDGRRDRQEVNLELGAAEALFPLTSRPYRLRVDPEMEWYAARADHEFGSDHR